MLIRVDQFLLQRIWRCGWLLFLTLLISKLAAAEPKFSFHEPSTFKINGLTFDLATRDGLAKLLPHAEALLTEKTPAKKDQRGLREIIRLAKILRETPSAPVRAGIQNQILEIAHAISNNQQSPVPPYVGLLDFPFRLADSLRNPVAKGRRPAANLAPTTSPDLSLADPLPSTFWKRPASISSADLFTGFGRAELPRFDDRLLSYADPKKSGANPGCELLSGDQQLKVKFAEIHSEPFTSRIFHALGYHVDPVDYSPGLRLKYDRRFILEFNSRPEITMKIGMFFIPIYTFHFERIYDPFDYIERAVLKDGVTLSGSQLKTQLLHDPNVKISRFTPEYFRASFESLIDYLVTKPCSVQVDDDNIKSIGPWGFEDLGHEHLREIRGAGVLAAWLSWWDSRLDNTRLRLVNEGGEIQLRHYFNDLGGGLGRSAGTFRHSTEKPDDFPWTFTRTKTSFWGNKPRFAIIDYEPIVDTPAFKEITLDDARWMARLIAQLTENQITSALTASGFSPPEVRLYTEKLISRRDQLIRDTQLLDEFPLLREGEAIHGN